MKSFSERRSGIPTAGRTVLAAALLALLTACETSPFESFGFGSPEASAESGAEGVGGQPTGAEAGSEEGQVVETYHATAMDEPAAEAPAQQVAPNAAPAVAAVPAEPAINDDPQQLIGMGPASLSAFLGAPELIRRESPASLWQYRTEDCVLDIVLYTERSGDKVTYLEAREDGVTKVPARQCLNKLLRSRLDDSAG